MFPRVCGGCGKVKGRLVELFVNGLGWRHRCDTCASPPAGPPRAYLGPYPVTAAVALAAGNENARIYAVPGGDAGGAVPAGISAQGCGQERPL